MDTAFMVGLRFASRLAGESELVGAKLVTTLPPIESRLYTPLRHVSCKE